MNPSSSSSTSINEKTNVLRRSARIANLEHKESKSNMFVSSKAQSRKTNKISHLKASAPVQPHCDVDIRINSGPNINAESVVDDDKISHDSADCNASFSKLVHPNRKTNVLPNLNRNKKDKLQYPKSNDPIWKEKKMGL